MAAKEEKKDHEDQHVAHVAFKIPDFWPHDLNTWFWKIGTYFMAAFLLRLPADMIDHIISQDFKDCNKMAEYADKLYARRRCNTVADVNETTVNAVSGGRRRENSPNDRRRRSPSRQGRSRKRTPGPYKEDSDICFYHHTYGDSVRKCKPGCQWVPGNGSAAEN
jgi:hypothetical protein